MARGVVIPGPVTIDSTGASLRGDLDPVEWRRLALYWDKIESPYLVWSGPMVSSDAKQLAAAGILTQPKITFEEFGMGGRAHGGADVAEVLIRGQLKAF